jgi:hypothetical protein
MMQTHQGVWKASFMRPLTLIALLSLTFCGLQAGCTTIAWEATDAISEEAAEEESPAEEASEGPVEHAVEEAGKTTQKGIQKVEAVKEEAIDKAKETVD